MGGRRASGRGRASDSRGKAEPEAGPAGAAGAAGSSTVGGALRSAVGALLCAGGAATATAVAAQQPAPVQPAGAVAATPWALTGGTLVDGTGAPAVPDAVVLVTGERITCAGPRGRCPVPAGVPVRDVSGHWIVPGLIDGHVHYSQTGWTDGRPDQGEDLRADFPYERAVAENRAHPERYFRAYLCAGVTATWDVGGYPWTWDLRARAEHDPLAPHVAAAGPLLSARDHWLNVPAERQFVHMASEAAVDTAARYVVAHDSDAVKVWYLVSERMPGAAAYQARLRVAARRAREADIPLIVHATTLWAAKDALRAGARHLVHSVEDEPVDEEFLQLARANGASYNPTLTVYAGILRFRLRDPSLPDADLACVDPDTRRKVALTAGLPGAPSAGQRAALLERARPRELLTAENLRRVHAAGIPIVTGTDAGNTLTLHGASVFAEMEAMQAAGLTPLDVLVASTRNAARAMGRGDDLGTVEAGKVADLTVVAADPLADVANLRRVAWVVRAGRMHARRELEAGRP